MGKCMSKNSSNCENVKEETVVATFVQLSKQYSISIGQKSSVNNNCMPTGMVSSQLFVKNVDLEDTEEELLSFFKKLGAVTHIKKDYLCQHTVLVTFAKDVDWFKVFQVSPQELTLKGKFLHLEKPCEEKKSWTDHKPAEKNGAVACAINTLPNEMLDYIFSFLSIKERFRTERVCRRWRDIGKNLSWSWPKMINLGAIEAFWDDDSLLLSDHIVSSILSRCGRSVRQLELSTKVAHSQLVTREAVVTIGNCCPNLIDIRLDDLPGIERFDPKSYLEPLAQGCPKIRHFTILNTSFTDDSLSAYFKQCDLSSASQSGALETFALVRNDMVVGQCFNDISKNLKGLRLFGCYRVRPEIALTNLMNRCENVQELSLRYCCETLKPDLLSQILNCYKNTLNVLSLDGHGFKPSVWSESVCVLRGVEKVSLEKCRGVHDEVLQVLAEKCVNLRVLNISGTHITDVGITHVAKCCVNLRALNICETLTTDVGVSALAINCLHLCALNVSYTSITDVGVSVLASAPRLKMLDISYTSEVTGVGINDLAEKGQIEELYVRAINKDNNVVQESCISLSKYCANLRVLDVRATKNINNTLVEELRKALHRGFLKGPVHLYVGLTMVEKTANQNDRLNVCFDTNFRKDFFNTDYFDGS